MRIFLILLNKHLAMLKKPLKLYVYHEAEIQ